MRFSLFRINNITLLFLTVFLFTGKYVHSFIQNRTEQNFITLKAVLRWPMRNMEYTNFCGKIGLTGAQISLYYNTKMNVEYRLIFYLFLKQKIIHVNVSTNIGIPSRYIRAVIQRYMGNSLQEIKILNVTALKQRSTIGYKAYFKNYKYNI